MIQEILTALKLSMTLTTILFVKLIGRLSFLPCNRQGKWTTREMDELVYGLIEKARANTGERGDLLSFLVNATDEDVIDDPLSDEEIWMNPTS